MWWDLTNVPVDQATSLTQINAPVQTLMSVSPTPCEAECVEGPVSTPQAPICVPVPTDGGHLEGEGRVKILMSVLREPIAARLPSPSASTHEAATNVLK